MKEIFTIGYSSYSLESFIIAIQKYSISAIADVRSIPYSKFKPDFNRELFKDCLNNKKIEYVFLGDNCGARIEAPECYINGKADYRLIANHPVFQEGLERIRNGIKKYRIALMCAEADPVNCHRTILVCRNLRSVDLKIEHILNNGGLEDHAKTEKRLMKLFNLYQPSLFKTESESLEEAYDLQGEKIAYRDNNEGRDDNESRYDNERLEEEISTGGVERVLY